MPEAYTCICGCDKFSIFSGHIKCSECGKEYEFQAVGGSIPWVFEHPSDFNERIRKEAKDARSL